MLKLSLFYLSFRKKFELSLGQFNQLNLIFAYSLNILHALEVFLLLDPKSRNFIKGIIVVITTPQIQDFFKTKYLICSYIINK